MTGDSLVHYLGPAVGNIPLSTWADIVHAAGGGLLEETQWVELKKQLGPVKKEVNAELARDLASLSVHGGVLIFGIVDKTFEVVGCDVDGLAARISQVASMGIHPPLAPVIREVPHPADAPKGCLVIEVPPSPHAPHMVDGHYWGRSSDGKRKLSDPEVRALLAARTGSDSKFRQRLLAMPDQNPIASLIEGHPTGNGHIYLLAEPCAPVVGRRNEPKLQNIVVGMDFERNGGPGTLGSLAYTVGDPVGIAVSSTHSDQPADRSTERYLCYLLCHDDDSSLEFVSGAGTIPRKMIRRMTGEDNDVIEYVAHATVIQCVHQFFRLIRELSLKHWGYLGQWRVGIHVTNLGQKVVATNDGYFRESVFSRDTYTSQLVVSPATWEVGVELEVKKLLAGFLRAIGCEDRDLGALAAL